MYALSTVLTTLVHSHMLRCIKESEMAALVERPKADATITMRIPVRTRDLIDSAAAVEGKTRTEFVLESARLHAIDVLLDQRVFALDPEESTAFAEVLDNTPKPNDALKALMKRPPPWA